MRVSLNLDTNTRRRRGGAARPPQDKGPRGPLKVLLRSLALLLLLLLSFAAQDSQAVGCSKNSRSPRRRHVGAPLPCCWLHPVHGVVWPVSQGCSFQGTHPSLPGFSVVASQEQRVRCLGGDSSSAGGASGDLADPLRGVHFYVSPTMAAPDVWDEMPRECNSLPLQGSLKISVLRLVLLPLLTNLTLLLFWRCCCSGLLRGPAAYEATAVQRLRAAGASTHFVLPRGNSSSTSTSSKSGSSRTSATSRSPVVHLAVSPTPPLHVDANESCAAAAASSSSTSIRTEGGVQAAPNANEETPKKDRPLLRHELAFCPSRGMVSCFGCFAAATALLEEGPSSGSVAVTKRGPSSPLLHASWGPPALWLCGTEAPLLRRSFRVLSGVDPRDLQTVHFQQQQQQLQRQRQQQQQKEKLKVRVALLSIENRQTPLLSFSPEEQQMSKNLQQLHQHQQQQQCVRQLMRAGDFLVRRLEAETVRRAVVGGALLQCCELAGLLLRIGDGGPSEGPPKPAQLQHQQAQLQQEQQQQQERQQQSYWDRVFCERTEAFSSTLKRRLLLGGALLKDPRKAILLQRARAAQEALRLQLESLLKGADALLHVAEGPLWWTSMGWLVRRTSAVEGPLVDRQGEAANPTATFTTWSFRGEQAFDHCKQLLGAVAAAGYPCIASVEGWVLLGSPGDDELLLDIAAALCSKQHSL
ncbi:hypothetical protein Esti_004715 [Eimeria stiedai]